MIIKHEPGRSLQGLSGVRIVCIGRDIPELTASVGGLKTRMPLQPRTPLPKSMRLFVFLATF